MSRKSGAFPSTAVPTRARPPLWGIPRHRGTFVTVDWGALMRYRQPEPAAGVRFALGVTRPVGFDRNSDM